MSSKKSPLLIVIKDPCLCAFPKDHRYFCGNNHHGSFLFFPDSGSRDTLEEICDSPFLDGGWRYQFACSTVLSSLWPDALLSPCVLLLSIGEMLDPLLDIGSLFFLFSTYIYIDRNCSLWFHLFFTEGNSRLLLKKHIAIPRRMLSQRSQGTSAEVDLRKKSETSDMCCQVPSSWSDSHPLIYKGEGTTRRVKNSRHSTAFLPSILTSLKRLHW